MNSVDETTQRPAARPLAHAKKWGVGWDLPVGPFKRAVPVLVLSLLICLGLVQCGGSDSQRPAARVVAEAARETFKRTPTGIDVRVKSPAAHLRVRGPVELATGHFRVRARGDAAPFLERGASGVVLGTSGEDSRRPTPLPTRASGIPGDHSAAGTTRTLLWAATAARSAPRSLSGSWAPSLRAFEGRSRMPRSRRMRSRRVHTTSPFGPRPPTREMISETLSGASRGDSPEDAV